MIMLVTATHGSHYLLALATLGGMTSIGMILSVSHHSRWQRQVQSSDIACCCRWQFCKQMLPI